jgi:hypothetical protein
MPTLEKSAETCSFFSCRSVTSQFYVSDGTILAYEMTYTHSHKHYTLSESQQGTIKITLF